MINVTVTALVSIMSAALTPKQRLYAIKNMEGHETIFTNVWFLFFVLCVIVIASIFLLVIHRYRRDKKRLQQELEFDERCERYGFSADERKVFEAIAKRSHLKEKTMVFTMAEAYDRGSAKLMRELFAAGLDLEGRRNLNRKVNRIKLKLGFGPKTYSPGLRLHRGKSLSSRQIPAEKRVSVLLESLSDMPRMDAVVTDNNEMEMILRLDVPINCSAGDRCNVQYRYGGSVWEFESLTVSCDRGQLVLSHSDNVRFINRRRFLRVKVTKPALVAYFPSVAKMDGKTRTGMSPKFFKAEVVEMAGPGIRLETTATIKPSDRVLVIFELEKGKLIEDVGEVRGVREMNGRYSIGIEMVGLNDTGVDELVKATNNAAMNFTFDEHVHDHALAFAKDETVQNQSEVVYE